MVTSTHKQLKHFFKILRTSSRKRMLFGTLFLAIILIPIAVIINNSSFDIRQRAGFTDPIECGQLCTDTACACADYCEGGPILVKRGDYCPRNPCGSGNGWCAACDRCLPINQYTCNDWANEHNCGATTPSSDSSNSGVTCNPQIGQCGESNCQDSHKPQYICDANDNLVFSSCGADYANCSDSKSGSVNTCDTTCGDIDGCTCLRTCNQQTTTPGATCGGVAQQSTTNPCFVNGERKNHGSTFCRVEGGNTVVQCNNGTLVVVSQCETGWNCVMDANNTPQCIDLDSNVTDPTDTTPAITGGTDTCTQDGTTRGNGREWCNNNAAYQCKSGTYRTKDICDAATERCTLENGVASCVSTSTAQCSAQESTTLKACKDRYSKFSSNIVCIPSTRENAKGCFAPCNTNTHYCGDGDKDPTNDTNLIKTVWKLVY